MEWGEVPNGTDHGKGKNKGGGGRQRAAGDRRSGSRLEQRSSPPWRFPGAPDRGLWPSLLTGTEGSCKVPDLFKHVAQNYKALFPELPNLKTHINDSVIKISFHIPHMMKASSVPVFSLRSLLLLRWSPLYRSRVHSVTGGDSEIINSQPQWLSYSRASSSPPCALVSSSVRWGQK